jgi:hypothetical protein
MKYNNIFPSNQLNPHRNPLDHVSNLPAPGGAICLSKPIGPRVIDSTRYLSVYQSILSINLKVYQSIRISINLSIYLIYYL